MGKNHLSTAPKRGCDPAAEGAEVFVELLASAVGEGVFSQFVHPLERHFYCVFRHGAYLRRTRFEGDSGALKSIVSN